ncbi:MAG: T9SS C-terminal target domain-containing protein, partial [Bacteroidetes bacterium]
NPVKEWINIYHKEDFTGAKEYLAQIINSQGQVVFEKTMSPNEHSISSSFLSEGVYILRLKTKKGQFMERFVKM